MNVLFTKELDQMITTAKGHEFELRTELRHVFLPAGDHWELSYKGLERGRFETRGQAETLLKGLIMGGMEEETPPAGACDEVATLTSVQITNLENMGWEFLQVGPSESAWMKFDLDGKHVAHGGDDTWKRDLEDSRAAGPASYTFSPFSLEVLDDPHFVGLWTYRPHGRPREFSASVMIDGQVQETKMHVSWAGALREAGKILKEETVP